MKLPSSLRALSYRNFRLFFLGQGISLIGTWMQQVALAWVVYRLTGSAWWLGLAGFAAQAPTFFLAPLVGVLVDRWNRRSLLLATQAVAMVQAFAVAFLTLAGVLEIWQIMVLSVVLGLVNAFDMPARQSFLVQMVGDHDSLTNAIALNSSLVNATRLIGPALAGLLLAQSGEGFCFLLNGFSYVAVLASLLMMRIQPMEARPHMRILAGLREGIVYAWSFHPIRALLLLVGLMGFMGISYSVLMPVFATQVLGGGPALLGYLSAAAGLGALGGAIILARRDSVLGLGRWITTMPTLFGLSVIAFSFSRNPWLSALFLASCGFAVMLHLAASNTLLQTIVEDDKRGRVMSLYAMAFLGTAPFGSLLAGVLAGALGAQVTVRIAGASCIIGSIAFGLRIGRLREKVRPIYISKGILPAVAIGIQNATSVAASPSANSLVAAATHPRPDAEA